MKVPKKVKKGSQTKRNRNGSLKKNKIAFKVGKPNFKNEETFDLVASLKMGLN